MIFRESRKKRERQRETLRERDILIVWLQHVLRQEPGIMPATQVGAPDWEWNLRRFGAWASTLNTEILARVIPWCFIWTKLTDFLLIPP